MKRLFVTALVALLATLVVGVAFAENNDPVEDPTDKPEQNYGNLVAPGIPDNLGPEDHQNMHCGENGWKADPSTNDFIIKLPVLILMPFMDW